MTTQLRSAPLRAIGRMSGDVDGQAPGATGLGRLIQVVLALYLIPALLIVLLVGGIGMLVLAVARVFTAVVYGPDSWPRTPVGPRTLSSDFGRDDSRR
jgi:hypothetical protein